MSIGAGMENVRKLEQAARDCESEADRLRGLIAELTSRARKVFDTWSGVAAKSLDTYLQEDLTNARNARERLHRAAAILRKNAADLKKAIEAAEQREREAEQRKRDAERKAAEGKKAGRQYVTLSFALTNVTFGTYASRACRPSSIVCVSPDIDTIA